MHSSARQHWITITSGDFLEFIQRYVPECDEGWQLLSVQGGSFDLGEFDSDNIVEVVVREPQTRHATQETKPSHDRR